MANSKSAEKRARQNKKRYELKHAQRMRTAVKRVEKAVETKDKNKKETFKTTQAVLDNLANKGVIHKNKAARLKSRLSKKIKAS